MPTLFPTKEMGAKTLPTLMTIAAPEQQMSLDALESLGAEGKLNGLLLANLLSAFTQLERDAVHLYRVVATRTQNDEWRARYEAFGKESEDHVRIYEELITRLGGDPLFVSPMARMCEHKSNKMLDTLLLSGSVDELTLELTGLEAVIAAEQQCHSNWELLSALAEKVSDPTIKGALQDAVKQVMPQEDEHLTWAKTTWQNALLGYLTKQA